MALRWCAAGMVEARAQFRRVNGHLHLRAPRASVERHVGAGNVSRPGNNETVIAVENLRQAGHPLRRPVVL